MNKKALYCVFSLLGCYSVGAMENIQPDHAMPKEFTIMMDRLDTFLKQQEEKAKQNTTSIVPPQVTHKPEDIVITMTMPQFLEMQKKSEQQLFVQQLPVTSHDSPQGQNIEQALQNVRNGVSELQAGRPYNAWHYISSGGSLTATAAGIVTIVTTIVLLFK